jgi:hypothetical protein
VTRRLGAAVAATLLLLAVGCGGDDGDDNPDDAAAEAPDTPDTDAPPTDEVPDDGSDGEDVVDACALLEEIEVEPYVGPTGPGSGGDGQCAWENPESFESVTVTIYQPGTAVDGLPEPSPYGEAELIEGVGDDARYSASNGIVEFQVGDRLCELQLATPVTLEDDAQREGAIDLAELVVERL